MLTLSKYAPARVKLAELRSLADSLGGTWRDVRRSFRYRFRSLDGAYNPECTVARQRHCRWVEDWERAGLRRVGFADEILTRLRHRGWYTDDEMQDEVYRGSVYQLPARHGKPQFVYGYDDPNNARAALLVFEPCDEKEDAAHYADGFAEHCAEEEREHQREENRKLRIDELRSDIKTYRADIKALVRDLKATRRQHPKSVCKALRAHLARLRELSHEAYEELSALA